MELPLHKHLHYHSIRSSISGLGLPAVLLTALVLAGCSSSKQTETTNDVLPPGTDTEMPADPVSIDNPVPEPALADDYALIDSITRKIRTDLDASTAVIAIRLDSNPIYTKAFGSEDDPGTAMALASLSKPVTAFILQKMQDDGLIALSDPINLHVPEISMLINGDRIANKTLFQFMTHNAGLASVTSYDYPDWIARLNEVLSQPAVSGYQYANDNFTLLTRVVMNVLGSYQSGLDQYINTGGISTFRIGEYHNIPSYAGVGEIEASAADYLHFAERAAPLSELQSGIYGIAWLHNPAGFLDHTGVHWLGAENHFSQVMWAGYAASGARISFVLQADGKDDTGGFIYRYLDAL